MGVECPFRFWPNQCLRFNSSRADGEWKPQLAGVSQKRPTDVEPITPFDVTCWVLDALLAKAFGVERWTLDVWMLESSPLSVDENRRVWLARSHRYPQKGERLRRQNN